MSEALLVGSCIGQYRLASEIGHGGMGIVYEAIHDEIGRRAAIKVLSPRCADDPRFVRRFLNEARTISRVRHPGLVQIYDFGQTPSGAPYILMERLDGDTLRGRLTRHAAEDARLPLVEIRRVVRQIAAALAATHDEGIVHRDLKPDNVMLVADEEAPGGERVKLLDFGIARFLGSQDLMLTAPGTAIGTAAYMSPEQCAGDAEIAAATDVYALGVMLHEMLVGVPPFRGQTSSDVMRMHLVAEPPALPRSVPRDLAGLVERMLAKEPTRRPTMRCVARALADTAGRPEVSPDPPASDEQTTETHDLTVTRADAPAPLAAARSIARRGARRRRGLALALLVAAASAAVWPAYRAWPGPASPVSPPAVLAGMAWFPGGTFRMGRTAEEVEAECKRLGPAACIRDMLDREQPAREVTLSPFYLDKLEATNEEVARWLTTIKPALEVRVDEELHTLRWVYLDGVQLLDLMSPSSATSPSSPLLPSSGIEQTADEGFRARAGYEHKPVGQITWDGASLYCRGRGKRLPTEAEWEFAARGHTARRFPWGEQEPHCGDVAWGRDPLQGQPCAPSRDPGPLDVGTAPLDRTPEDVRDLGGNDMEWTQDQYLTPYLPDCGWCVNPLVERPVPIHEDVRVLRGGSWPQGWHMARSTMRGRLKRTNVWTNVGVRCASQ